MVELFFKGLLIGIISSAPMGPAGLLCIQRTLNKGRWHGFATGLGAATSDLFYSVITGLGMGFLFNFISNHIRNMQLWGSILLLFLGGYIFMNKVAHRCKNNKNIDPTHLIKDFTTGFLITASNVLIIFLLIALFAHLQFITLRNNATSYIVGYGGILLGAAGWWFAVTFLIDKLREKFIRVQPHLINRVTGSLIVLLSLVGIISALCEKNIIG